MKKTKTLLMLVAVLTIFTACSGNNNEVSGDNNSSGDYSQISGNVVNNSSDEAEVSYDPNFSLGKWDESVYTNEFLKIKFNLPDGWNRATDEEIAQVMNLTADEKLSDEETRIKLAKYAAVYHIAVTDPYTGDNLAIVTEKPTGDHTIEEYMQQLKTQLNAGMSGEYKIGEILTETIGNEQYNTLEVSETVYDLSQKYFIRKEGQYFIGIIITSTSGDVIDGMVENFE